VVGSERITEPVTEDAEPLGAADAMLDTDAEAAERPVVLLLLYGQCAAFRLLVGELQVGVLPGSTYEIVSMLRAHELTGQELAHIVIIPSGLLTFGAHAGFG